MLSSFRLAIFLGAGLLFLIQPMFAKMVLPMLGGSPAVWNTCMLFFQGMLLAGYGYAHLSHRFLGTKAQVILHLIILSVVIFLPAIAISKDWNPPENDTPIFWLLGLLLVVVGGPFFAVSATSPLLQQWFAATHHERAGNPYFLYSASNFGSILALLAYPFLIERIFALDSQAQIWKYGYIVFVLSMIGCAVFVFKAGKDRSDAQDDAPEESTPSPVTWKQRIYWIGLAFVPSSWMLGVTSFLTTDISPMPVLWIIPLSIYLITFIIAFADKPVLSSDWMARAFPVAMLVVVTTTIFQGGFLVMGIHLLVFFVGSMACHFELAKSKPDPRHLTEFYLLVSFGGMLGGVFNGLVAPVVFPWILEYPLTLMVACLLFPSFEPSDAVKKKTALELTTEREKPKPEKSKSKKKKRQKESSDVRPTPENEEDFLRKVKLGSFVAFVAVLALLANTLEFRGTVVLLLTTMFGLAALCVCFFLNKPVWFSIPLGVVLIIAKLEPPQPGETVLYTARGFFGVNRVVDGPKGFQKRLYHGTTVHGIQSNDPERPDMHLQPMSYYHRSGPLGMIFENAQKPTNFQSVGVIGLGAGTAATYHQPGQRFTFYEIDPIVAKIAEDPEYFSFLSECGKDHYKIVLGDGRLQLDKEEDGTFDFLVFDAFSSDAIPMHLLTREAVEMYASKLGDNGLMAFHISNLHFDLEPILGDIAAELKLDTLTCHDVNISEEEMIEGKAAASYVVIAKDLERTGLKNHPKWKSTETSARNYVWTDDFSNLFDALK